MMEGVTKQLAQRQALPQFAENNDAIMTRRLNDGREFQVVKVYYLPDDLTQRLKSYELAVTVKQTENFFLYGWGTKLAE
jgi:demethylmenaquinone methyltransferase/2-methoxy-6-polyprenyl-1,4-benzoquinol methylase